jgi:predicted SAM-dependent methyltransferase
VPVLPAPNESFRAWTRRVRASLIAAAARKTNLTRDPLSHIFLRGHGLEIGALNNPLAVPNSAKTRFVDRLPTEELTKLYVDVDPHDIRPVDIVTEGETLAGVPDDSEDFVIANHMVEHCEDPIGTIRHMLRVLKVGGILFMTLPDKRFTFDIKRQVHSFDHVKKDFLEGPENSRLGHYIEWLRDVDGITDEKEINARATQLNEERANIHFHAWDEAAMMEMLARMQSELSFRFDVEVMSRTGLEVIFVMRKTGAVPSNKFQPSTQE